MMDTTPFERPWGDAGPHPEVARPALHLVVEGRAVPLPRGRRTIIGGAPEAGIRLAGQRVAPRHAGVRADSDAVVVEDLGSERGVVVRGARVERARLEPGGVMTLGRTPLIVAQAVGRRCAGAVAWQGMIGRSSRTFRLWEELVVAGSTRAPVWLHGESGTGKELAARAIHATSDRGRGPLVAINCAALPAEIAEAELFGVVRGAYTGASRDRPGAFASADGGTLLLDEIGDLPPTIQAKLLRALEEGEVLPVGGDRPVRLDVRVIAATWRDLEAEAAVGRFRHDLLHRLWVLRVDVPPLRRRQEDVAPLIDALIAGSGIWPDLATLRAAEQASWPGNVRQLRNHVQRAVARGDARLLVPEAPEGRGRLALRRGQSEPVAVKHLIRDALLDHRGRREETAAALGISRSTLYRWLRDLG